jgi:hypothetical protein
MEPANQVTKQWSRCFGREMQLLKFEGIQESLLLIPVGRKRVTSTRPQEYLSTRLAWALVSIESDGELRQTVREFSRWRAGLARPSVGEAGDCRDRTVASQAGYTFPGRKRAAPVASK